MYYTITHDPLKHVMLEVEPESLSVILLGILQYNQNATTFVSTRYIPISLSFIAVSEQINLILIRRHVGKQESILYNLLQSELKKLRQEGGLWKTS